MKGKCWVSSVYGRGAKPRSSPSSTYALLECNCRMWEVAGISKHTWCWVFSWCTAQLPDIYTTDLKKLRERTPLTLFIYLFIYFLYFKHPFMFCMAFHTFRFWQQCSVNAYQIRPCTEFRCSSGHIQNRSFRCLKTIHVKWKASVKHWCPQEWPGIRRCPGPFFIVA